MNPTSITPLGVKLGFLLADHGHGVHRYSMARILTLVLVGRLRSFLAKHLGVICFLIGARVPFSTQLVQ